MSSPGTRCSALARPRLAPLGHRRPGADDARRRAPVRAARTRTRPRVGVGDLSLPEGGYFGPEVGGGIGHATHQNGLDVDVYYPRLDRRERPPRTVDRSTSRCAQELVDLFVAAGATHGLRRPEPAAERPPRRRDLPLVNHDNHLHARIARDARSTCSARDRASRTRRTSARGAGPPSPPSAPIARPSARSTSSPTSGFPVERAAIVGTGLKTVEQIAGRMTTGRAALMGAAPGSDDRGPLRPAVRPLLRQPTRVPRRPPLRPRRRHRCSAPASRAIGQAAQRGRRDFASIQSMQAERYELQVDHEVSAKAKQELLELD